MAWQIFERAAVVKDLIRKIHKNRRGPDETVAIRNRVGLHSYI